MLTGSIKIVFLRSLESVHRLSYFLFCNVLHIYTIRAIPTYNIGGSHTCAIVQIANVPVSQQ